MLNALKISMLARSRAVDRAVTGAEKSVFRANLIKAGKDTFFLRTTSTGWNMDNPDPDNLLPNVEGSNGK